MKIGIDARMIEHSGIGVRIVSFLKQIDKIDTSYFEFYLFGNTQKLQKLSLSEKFTIIEYNREIYSFKEFLGHPKMKNMDILDIPHFNVPIRFLTKCVVTIHDLIPITMQHFYPSLKKKIYLKIIFFLIKHFAKEVISVSNYTKSDLVHFANFKKEKITTIYNGIDHSIFQSYPPKRLLSFKKLYNLPNQFLLCVGIGKKHKNLDFLIENLTDLWNEKETDIPLVLGGVLKENKDLILKKYEKFKRFIIILPKLSFEEVPLLYNSANLLIYPSLYEGFGFPVLEAAACFCPVFSSNATVLPEILKDTAYFFDPQDSENFKIELMFILNSRKNLEKNIEKAHENSLNFTWKKSVHSYLSLLRKI